MKNPEDLFLDVKSDIRYHLILSAIPTLSADIDKRQYEQAATELVDQLLGQLRYAIELERADRINDAISIYEALVAEQIDNIHSYHRLFQYYGQIGDMEMVRRICRSYIEMTYHLEAIGVVRKDLTSLRVVFEEYI